MSTDSLAEQLARFTASLRYDTIPADVVASVRLRVLDVLGLALAASTRDFAAPVIGAVDVAAGPCTIIGSRRIAMPAMAALANGTLAHGLDFDDTHAGSITHASAVVIPSALAVAEVSGISGRDVITAAVAGYEAIARIGMAVPGAFHARGWHATSTCGVFAAALAAGKLMGLDARQLTHALGLAGSFAGGLMEFLEDGSAVKRLHAGWAAHGGVLAATLAAGGVTGPASVLEGRFGFYRTFVGAEPNTEVFATLGSRWETTRISFKPYPCCHLSHAYIDCALRLRNEQRVEPDAIASIECRVPAGEVPIVCEPRAVKLRPRTTYEAQFSLPYAVAAAFIDGRVGLDTFTPERLGDERLLALADKVQHVVDPTSTFPDGFPGWIRVRLDDARVVEVREPDGRGSPTRPLPEAAIVEKFRDNVGGMLTPSRRDELERAVLALDGMPDVRKVMGLCRAVTGVQ
jgi:2-methylcitrate dehydratase PrpD